MDAHVGLFENQRETNLTSTIAMIEDVLIELGHFLNECRVDDSPALREWRVVKGSASITIALVECEDFTHLRVFSTVLTVEDGVDVAALFRHVLELNVAAVWGAAFGMVGDELQLVAERSTLDLDRSEVLDVIRRVEGYADEFDDKLVAQFGGRLGSTI